MFTDPTPAQQDAMEQDWTGPSDEDWDWYMEATYCDPAER